MKCLVCGKPVPQKYNKTRFDYALTGRPKTYCSDACRNFQKYFIACQKELDKIDLDDEHKRKLRGYFFRVGNSLKFPTIVNFGTKTSRGDLNKGVA